MKWLSIFRLLKPAILRRNLLHFFKSSEIAFLLIAIIVGLGAGYGAVLFRWLIDGLRFLFFYGGKQIFSSIGVYYVVLVPIIGGLIIGPVIYFFARETKGHGVPEVMLAVATMGGRIRPRVAAIKSLVSSICIASGGSVGKEGPIAQIGSSIGSSLGQLMKLPDDKVKILVACGAAGGIAATFNAPLAGTFFSLEVILGEYGPKNISAIVVSAVTSTVISRSILGNYPAFMTPEYQLLSVWEFPLYFVFGFLAALTALLYVTVLYKGEDLFDGWKGVPEYLKPAVGGLIIGAMGLFFPEIFGVGYESIELAIFGKLALKTVLALVFLKILATTITIGSGGSGGVFAPSLFIGAMLGEAFGKFANIILPDIAMPPGACALVGMGAVFAGSAQAPISAIMILFEMTGNYKIILPLMITCIISTLVVRHFSKESIYTMKLIRRGIDINKLRGMDLIDKIKVSESMVKNVITVPNTATANEVFALVRSCQHRGYPVIDERNELAGIVTLQDVNRALSLGMGDKPVTEIMTKDYMACLPDQSLRTAIEKFCERNVGRIPVVDPEDRGKLLGLLTRKSIIHAYNRILKKRAQSEKK